MKTELLDFCSEYSEFTAPTLQSLDDAVEKINQESRADLLGGARTILANAQHRLNILAEKLEAQQAYLIIFGPLKSGKSTLMNAISGSYVSEVSSLPAYPCFVYVRDGETQSFSMTSYNGQSEQIEDGHELKQLVDIKHAQLAEELKKAEAENREFDPAVDYTEALRRIDISLPAADLAKSGVVLVDTPGLYTRMKFGYELMTRDFRDTAACAVFVVKTENLFLEQVFAEFNKLLEMFSRVFLVVNIDAGKKDLAPDGTLRPSAESETPQRVVEAFESLSMEAPLRRAFDEGRLRIYPIDLLGAAAERLSGIPSATDCAPGESANETSTADVPEKEPEHITFDAFLNDLSDYLNSSDYLAEFKRDSIHQGELIADELQQVASGEDVERLRSSSDELTERLGMLQQKLDAIQRAATIDWDSAYTEKQNNFADEVAHLAREAVTQLNMQLSGTLYSWFNSAKNLNELCEECFAIPIDVKVQRISDQAIDSMRRQLSGEFSGAELDQGSKSALLELEITPAKMASEPQSGMLVNQPLTIPKFELDVDGIPVKRGFFDYLFFRSPAAVRNSLFGPDGNRDIPERKKSKKLGDEARSYIEDQVGTYVKEHLVKSMREAAANLVKTHAEMLQNVIGEKLTDLEASTTQEESELQKEISEQKKLLELIDGPISMVAPFTEGLEALRKAHSAEKALPEEPEEPEEAPLSDEEEAEPEETVPEERDGQE